MNPAPLPQPTPFTCPQCGAGLESKPDFCPRCGAALETKRRARLSIGAVIGLTFGLILFGGIGACGGLLVSQSFGTQTGGEFTARDLLIFSVPSLLVGVLGFVLCLLPFFRKR